MGDISWLSIIPAITGSCYIYSIGFAAHQQISPVLSADFNRLNWLAIFQDFT
jgi:hypothetical protein